MEKDFVRMATELTRQANQMHEMQRIATTTRPAEERKKACAVTTAIGMAPE